MTTEGALMPQLRLLLEVDQHDRAVMRVTADREEIRQLVKTSKAELEALQKDLEAYEAQKLELEKSQKQRENDLKFSENKLNRLSTSTQVTSEKEFEAARREFETLKATKSLLEDAILEGIDEHERLVAAIAAQKLQLEARKRRYAEEHPALRARFDALGEELETLRRERSSLLQEMPPELREPYDRLILKYKDRAVTTIEDGRCPYCRIAVPPQHVVEVLMGKAMHICESCRRLILPAEGL